MEKGSTASVRLVCCGGDAAELVSPQKGGVRAVEQILWALAGLGRGEEIFADSNTYITAALIAASREVCWEARPEASSSQYTLHECVPASSGCRKIRHRMQTILRSTVCTTRKASSAHMEFRYTGMYGPGLEARLSGESRRCSQEPLSAESEPWQPPPHTLVCSIMSSKEVGMHRKRKVRGSYV